MIDAPFPFETNNDPPEQRIAVSAPGLIELIYEIREFPIPPAKRFAYTPQRKGNCVDRRAPPLSPRDMDFPNQLRSD